MFTGPKLRKRLSNYDHSLFSLLGSSLAQYGRSRGQDSGARAMLDEATLLHRECQSHVTSLAPEVSMLSVVETQSGVVSSTLEAGEGGLTLHQDEVHWNTPEEGGTGREGGRDGVREGGRDGGGREGGVKPSIKT